MFGAARSDPRYFSDRLLKTVEHAPAWVLALRDRYVAALESLEGAEGRAERLLADQDRERRVFRETIRDAVRGGLQPPPSPDGDVARACREVALEDACVAGLVLCEVVDEVGVKMTARRAALAAWKREQFAGLTDAQARQEEFRQRPLEGLQAAFGAGDRANGQTDRLRAEIDRTARGAGVLRAVRTAAEGALAEVRAESEREQAAFGAADAERRERARELARERQAALDADAHDQHPDELRRQLNAWRTGRAAA